MDTEREYPFEFSVVMAVYNVEVFLKEAVDGLIAQDFGFEKIQLIFVDDGSPDGSGAICDEYARQYPENVMVLHKENGGLSSARNAGVRVSRGKYISFIDPDDRADPQVFSAVHRFFESHRDETNVVALPVMRFGSENGPHMSNTKCKQGNRIIDLEKEWWSFHMQIASCFVRADKAKELCFQEDLVMACAEDSRELIKLFIDKPRLGVVCDGYYWYRKRSDSLVGGAQQKKLFYLPYLKDYSWWAIHYCLERKGTVPKNVQYTVMYDLQWKLRQKCIPSGVLTDEETSEYIRELKGVFKYIDDDVILAQRYIYQEHKVWILEAKYEQKVHMLRWNTNVLQAINDTVICSAAQNNTRLEFLKIQDGLCSLEGYVTIYPAYIQDIRAYLKVNGNIYPCEPVERNSVYCTMEEPISYRHGFRCSFPLCREDEKYSVRIIVAMNGIEVESQNLAAGEFFPVSRKYRNAYFIQDDWKVSMDKKCLTIRSCGRKGHIASEWAFMKELWKKNALGGRKAVLARAAYHILKRFKRKPVWLISDRVMKADDNGEAFFRYMQKEHRKEIKSCFVLSKNSADYARMKKLGPVVNNLSWKHKLLLLLCDYNISAQADAITIDPFPGYKGGVRDILSQERFVFLQHGVIKDDLSGWLNRYNKNMHGFVTSAYPEYQSILAGTYFYDKNQIWLTGLPRFDRRYHDEKNCITIMPTWRMYLLEAMDKDTGYRKLKAGFKESAFFMFYQGLLNDQRLISAAERTGYQLRFFPHPNIQPHLSEFDMDPSVEVLGTDTEYNDVYAQSNLIVTDYSSACFDFAYLRKPILYCQFDAEEFFEGEHVYTKGYFDYERDGFGEVEYDLEGTVDRIIEYMENGCTLKDKYRERIDNFFAFNDQNNCQRVYEKILELEKRG